MTLSISFFTLPLSTYNSVVFRLPLGTNLLTVFAGLFPRFVLSLLSAPVIIAQLQYRYRGADVMKRANSTEARTSTRMQWAAL